MERKRKYVALWIAVVIAVVVAFFNKKGELAYHTDSGVVWTTTYNVTYESERELGDSIIVVTQCIDKSASMYNRHSVLSRINDNSITEVDPIIEKLLLRSIEINGETGGAFDPTVAPLMHLWKLKSDSAVLPTEVAIDSVMGYVGVDKVALVDGNIKKVDHRVQLDFNAIAKGLGCDEVALMLDRNGVKNYLVEIGGEIVARGVNKRGKPWLVSIDMPVENGDTVLHSSAMVVQLSSGAIATSGNYRNYKVIDGQKVAHIIDPNTGRSALSNLLSVTVIADDCMNADAYATALMVMGMERAQEFAMLHDNLAIILIYATHDGAIRVWRSPTVADYEL